MGDEERIMTVRMTAAQYDTLRLALYQVATRFWREDDELRSRCSIVIRALNRVEESWDTGKRY